MKSLPPLFTTVETSEAETNILELIRRVECGEEIVIARSGRPIARLVAEKPRQKVKLGWMEGQIVETPGWADPLTPEEAAAMFGTPKLKHGDDEPPR